MFILTKAINRLNAIPVRLPNSIFHRTRTNNPKIHMEPKRPQIDKVILKKKNKTGGITIPGFKLYYKAVVIKAVWYWHKNRHTDE